MKVCRVMAVRGGRYGVRELNREKGRGCKGIESWAEDGEDGKDEGEEEDDEEEELRHIIDTFFLSFFPDFPSYFFRFLS